MHRTRIVFGLVGMLAALLVLAATGQAVTMEFSYDENGRLTKADYGSFSITFSYDADSNLVARNTGAEATQYTLTVTVSPEAGGTVTATGLSCPGDCTATYAAGSSTTLTATAAEGYTFSSWGGDCAGCTGNTCTLVLNADKTCTAEFKATSSSETEEESSSGGGGGGGCSLALGAQPLVDVGLFLAPFVFVFRRRRQKRL